MKKLVAVLTLALAACATQMPLTGDVAPLPVRSTYSNTVKSGQSNVPVSGRDFMQPSAYPEAKGNDDSTK